MSVHCEDCGLPVRGVCCSNCDEEAYIDYHQNEGLHPDDQKTVDEIRMKNGATIRFTETKKTEPLKGSKNSYMEIL